MLKFKRTKKQMIFVLTFILLASMCGTALAADYDFYDTSVNTGQSWTSVGTTVSYEYDSLGFFRTKTTDYKYKGSSSNFSAVKATSGNYYHTQGQPDLVASMIIAHTYTVKTSISGAAAAIGISLGFAYSYQSSMSVSSTIDQNLSSGYYYYGCKFRLRDFKLRRYVELQQLGQGSEWETISTSNNYYYASRVDYTGSGTLPVYYAWYAT